MVRKHAEESQDEGELQMYTDPPPPPKKKVLLLFSVLFSLQKYCAGAAALFPST